MGFSNAYFIPKTETVTRGDGQKVTRMPDEFKKYQLLRMAALFGFAVSRCEDKIMLTNGTGKIFIGEEPIPDVVFLDHVQKLKMGYNNLHANAFGPVQDKTLESKKFVIKDYSKYSTAEDAYTEEDPLLYTSTLLLDLETRGGDLKNKLYRQVIGSQMLNAIAYTKDTSWGKTISQSLDKFWAANDYILESGRSNASQPGE